MKQVIQTKSTFVGLLSVSIVGFLLLQLADELLGVKHLTHELFPLLFVVITFSLCIFFYKKRYGLFYTKISQVTAIVILPIVGWYLYVYFDHPIIWFPIGLGIIFLNVFFENESPGPDGKKKLFRYGNSKVLLFFVGLTSFFYRYWSSPLFFSYSGKEIALVIALIAITGVLLFFLGRKAEERKQLRLLLEKEAERLRKESRKKQVQKDKEKEIAIAISNILTEDRVLWKEIIFVSRFHNEKLERLSTIIPRIHLAPIAQLVTVHDTKQLKQLTWPGDVPYALRLIEEIVVNMRSDAPLQALFKQVADFASFIERYKQFKGGSRLEAELKKTCPKTLELISQKSSGS